MKREERRYEIKEIIEEREREKGEERGNMIEDR